MSWPRRLLLVGWGCGLGSLLILAATLEPDPRGFGTHQGLGLPPCTFYQWTGQRCPSCGMTTAWAQLVRGEVVRALRANAGGLASGCAALCLAPWALVVGLTGRGWGKAISERSVLGLVLVLVGITLIDWLIRLSLGQ